MELLVYIPKQTPRINYIFRHICGRILGFKVKFTSKVEDFISFEGVKFSYAKKRLGNEVFIQKFGLLEELGINDKILVWIFGKMFLVFLECLLKVISLSIFFRLHSIW